MMIDEAMIKTLDELLKRSEELERLLADSKVIADRATYQKYAKELSDYSKVVSAYKEYKKVFSEIVKVREILARGDQEEEFLKLAKEELGQLKKREQGCEEELTKLLHPEERGPEKDIIVEIRAGTGGEEAALFAADLFRMYTKFAQSHGWKVETMDTHPTSIGGLREITFSVKGKGAYRNFKYESGTHRVQRVPVTETGGRIHTSAVTLYVMPEAEEVELQINPKDLRIDVFRASGPGGQYVNVTDSAVRITHLPTGTVASCQDERSQHKNKAKAMRILRARLLDKVLSEERRKISRERKMVIGTGDRSQKIRTYNFPGRRVTDHRIGLTLHKLDGILEGNLDELISALAGVEQKKESHEKPGDF